MPQFLNSEQAKAEEAAQSLYELTRLKTALNLALMRNDALETLLKDFAGKIVELEVRIAMLEATHGNNGS